MDITQLKQTIADTFDPLDVVELLIDNELITIDDILDAFEEHLLSVEEFIPEEYLEEEID